MFSSGGENIWGICLARDFLTLSLCMRRYTHAHTRHTHASAITFLPNEPISLVLIEPGTDTWLKIHQADSLIWESRISGWYVLIGAESQGHHSGPFQLQKERCRKQIQTGVPDPHPASSKASLNVLLLNCMKYPNFSNKLSLPGLS